MVCNGDDIYGETSFKTLVEHFKDTEKNSNATIAYKLKNVVPEQGSVNRGIFELNENNTMKTLKEVFEITKQNLEEKNLTPESLCSMNIFAFTPQTLSLLNHALINFKEQNQGDRKVECLLPNEVGKLIHQGKISVKVYPTNEKWLGVTNPEDEEIIKEKLSTSHF